MNRVLYVVLLAMAGCARDISETDLAEARDRAESWLAAAGRQDCPTLLRLSQTGMTLDDCQAQASILADRFITIQGVGTVIPHPETGGAILAQGRFIEAASPEVLELTMVHTRAGWVVQL